MDQTRRIIQRPRYRYQPFSDFVSPIRQGRQISRICDYSRKRFVHDDDDMTPQDSSSFEPEQEEAVKPQPRPTILHDILYFHPPVQVVDLLCHCNCHRMRRERDSSVTRWSRSNTTLRYLGRTRSYRIALGMCITTTVHQKCSIHQ
jgi:hypothetical protein